MILHYYQVHVGDYLSETALMTLEQRFAYLHLRIISCRQNPPGTLPNDDAVLAQLLSVSDAQWLTLKPQALTGWKRKGTQLRNEEICRYHAKALHISDERKKAVEKREAKKRQGSIDPSLDPSIDHLSDIRYPKSDTQEETNSLSKNGQICASVVGLKEFWVQYPRKYNHAATEEAWRDLAPSPELVQTILVALTRQKQSRAWLKDDGRWIPAPAKWLQGHGWLNEEPPKHRPKVVV